MKTKHINLNKSNARIKLTKHKQERNMKQREKGEENLVLN